MNILCIGGGPAGLYFALLMKQQNPAHRVTVVERNRPFDTFGWGVVLSDQTLANLQAADAVSIAKKSGLTDGIADVSVSYYNYGPPIEQCVWDVKNFLERESGTSVIIIDSTQEVFEKKTWRRSS